MQHLQTIKSARGGKCKVESIDEREISDSHKFYSHIKDENEEEPEEEVRMLSIAYSFPHGVVYYTLQISPFSTWSCLLYLTH